MWMLWTVEWWQLTVQVWVMAWSTRLPLSLWLPKMQEKVKFLSLPLIYYVVCVNTVNPHKLQKSKVLDIYSSKVVFLWRWRVPLKPKSPVRTTKMVPVLSPTCQQLLETTTSLWSLTTSTFLAVPLLLRSLVRAYIISLTGWRFYTADVYL